MYVYTKTLKNANAHTRGNVVEISILCLADCLSCGENQFSVLQDA